jgi:hypothetical protein
VQASPKTASDVAELARKRIVERDRLIVRLNDAAEAIGRVDLATLGVMTSYGLDQLTRSYFQQIPENARGVLKVLHTANERDLAEIQRQEAIVDPFAEE